MRKTKKIILISASMIFVVALLIGGLYLYRHLAYYSHYPNLKYHSELSYETNVELQPICFDNVLYYYSTGEQEGIYRMCQGGKPELLFACKPCHYVCVDGDNIVWLVYEYDESDNNGHGYAIEGTKFLVYNPNTDVTEIKEAQHFSIPAVAYTEQEIYFELTSQIWKEPKESWDVLISSEEQNEALWNSLRTGEVVTIPQEKRNRIPYDWYWSEDENYYYEGKYNVSPNSAALLVDKQTGKNIFNFHGSWLHQESGINKWLRDVNSPLTWSYTDLQTKKQSDIDTGIEIDYDTDLCAGGVYLGNEKATGYGYYVEDGREIADSWMKKPSYTCEQYNNFYYQVDLETKEPHVEYLNWNQFIIYGNLEQLYLYDAEKKQIQTMQIGDDSKQIQVIAETDAIEENNTYYLVYSEYAILIYDTEYQVVDVIWL